MRTIPTLLTLAFALALAHPIAAEHCVAYSTTDAEVAADLTPTGGSIVYTDIDWCQLCTYGFTLWIYEEANGIPGLQRGDEVVDDTCHGSIASDRIIF